MAERIVRTNSDSETTEDLLDRIKREHSEVYGMVSALIPTSFEDGPKWAAMITGCWYAA